MAFLTKIFGDPNKRYISKLLPLVTQTNLLEASFKALTDDDLRAKTGEFRNRLAKGDGLLNLLPESFAAVREAARRTLGQRHFDVQLLGGIVLHYGVIAEMRTGEGKTLTATLPIHLNALEGKGVHVVTVNDYLARRDAVWMGQIYHALGMSIGCINHEVAYIYDPHYRGVNPKSEIRNPKQIQNSNDQNSKHKDDEGSGRDETRDTLGAFRVEYSYLRPVPRKEAYAADITYGTNNEYAFDYLRDNMAPSIEQMVGRGYHFAIVDEVDSILIDEARTPLIISAPREESSELYYKFAAIARKLREGEDYNLDLKMRAASITQAGIDKVEHELGVNNLYAPENLHLVHHLEQSLRAQTLYGRDKEYVVREGEVVIVDEFTGRLMFGRRYSEGLHQAIEAKEGVRIREESQTLATVTFQNYFRLYKKLAGMTGTALTEAEEFHKIYSLEVVAVPTNKPMIRRDTSDKIYKTEEAKLRAVVEEVCLRHATGQPVLLGTISIEKNEVLSQMLARAGVPHNLLNAKNHEREAEIIAQAGRRGAVTLATNMAGRGVDIILGGNPPNIDEIRTVRESGGLHVIGTERHESRRIDNQLRGRSGRQGDPGSSQFYVSLEDDLMKIFGSGGLKNLMTRLGLPDNIPIENKIVSRAIEAAQHKVESHNFDIRKHLLEYDDVLNKHREAVYRRRREILGSDNLEERVLEIVEDELEALVVFHTGRDQISSGEPVSETGWNLEEIYEAASTIFPLPREARIRMEDIESRAEAGKLADAEARTKIIEYLADCAKEAFWKLKNSIAAEPEPLLQAQHEVRAQSAIFNQILRSVFLSTIDHLWIGHLDSVEHLRTGIGLRGYAGVDPLVEYKREAYRMFQELLAMINKHIAHTVFRMEADSRGATRGLTRGRSVLDRDDIRVTAPSKEMGESHRSSPPLIQKIGRNDPCLCGSGKKYKKCHGDN